MALVAIVGDGGREHALAWAVARSAQVARVYCNGVLTQHADKVRRCQPPSLSPISNWSLSGDRWLLPRGKTFIWRYVWEAVSWVLWLVACLFPPGHAVLCVDVAVCSVGRLVDVERQPFLEVWVARAHDLAQRRILVPGHRPHVMCTSPAPPVPSAQHPPSTHPAPTQHPPTHHQHMSVCTAIRAAVCGVSSRVVAIREAREPVMVMVGFTAHIHSSHAAVTTAPV
jgi:hypothetical protein